MARPDLGGCPGNGVSSSVHARFLRWGRGNLFGTMVLGVGVPFVFGLLKLLRDPEFEVSEGSNL